MSSESGIPDRLFIVEGERIEGILRRAVRNALLAHKRAGNTIAVWNDNKVELIPAEQIQVESDNMPEGES